MKLSMVLPQVGFVSIRDGQRWLKNSPKITSSASRLHAASPLVLADAISTAADPSSQTTFEPVLNIPAFGAFFFIALIFGFLQYRIAEIGAAADRRTEALSILRELKSLEIAGKDIPAEEIEKAKENYRRSLVEVEKLRTVIPGFARIAPPSSESENRQRMEENVAAAKQFLDMDISSNLPPTEKDDKTSGGLSAILVGILAVVGLSQIALLFLFAFGGDPAGYL